MHSRWLALLISFALAFAQPIAAEQSCRDVCLNAANPNVATGVGFQYYDSDCLDLSKSGQSCVGRTSGCRMCKTKGTSGDPTCPQCIFDKYYPGSGSGSSSGSSQQCTSTVTVTQTVTVTAGATTATPTSTSTATPTPTTTAPAGYKLVWSDEFNGNSLDQSKWQYEINCDGGGNNEMQCYTNRPQNLEVKNGNLVITARPENYQNKQFTSARINTKGKASWKYGRFEMRAKLPNGAYLWPALWMMPRDSVYGSWAASGEIDIVEARGQTPNVVEGTLHFGGGWPNNVYEGSGPRDQGKDLTADFHVYTLEWTKDSISWGVDGNVYFTKPTNGSFNRKIPNFYKQNGQPFDQEFFFIINLAMGGGFFGGESQTLNQQIAKGWKSPQLLVDYVRVYQQQ